MIYSNLSLDGQIDQLFADISRKMKNSEKLPFLQSLGFSKVQEIYVINEDEKKSIIERLYKERAKRFTAADVSFSLRR